MSINKVLITGNLTRDPEVRTTASGSAILSFSVAVNDRRRDPSTGEWSDYANYIDCTMFGNRVDFFSRNLNKGSKVAVEGRLRWSQWEAKDGSKRSKIEVIADDIELMSSRGDGNSQGYAPVSAGGYSPAPVQQYAQAQPAYAPVQGYAQGYTQAPAQPAYAPAPAAPAYDGGYSPAITSPAIDESSVYEDDIPF